MKQLVKFVLLLLVAISFAACEKASNPVSPNSLNKQNLQALDGVYSGTFALSTRNGEVVDHPESATGSIVFTFNYSNSTYKYSGTFDSASQIDYIKTIKDSGKFLRKGDTIIMRDNPLAITDLRAHTSLNLEGDYKISTQGNKTLIEGLTKDGNIKIVLD